MQENSGHSLTRIITLAIRPFQDYGNFWIRVSRREYWSFLLLFAALASSAVFLLYLTGYQFTAVAPTRWDVTLPENGLGVTSGLAGLLMVGLMLAFAVPLVATAVGRLHDLGRSGWWLLAFAFGDSFFLRAGGTDVWTTIVDAAFIVTMSLKGQAGVNRFGSPPDSAEEVEAGAT